MVIRPHPLTNNPFYRPPNYGIDIDGVIYRYAIDVMTLVDNKTFGPDSHDFAVACRMALHVRANPNAPNGLIPVRQPTCLADIPAMPVLKCDHKTCNPGYIGTVMPAFRGLIPKKVLPLNTLSSSFNYHNVSWAMNVQNTKSGEYLTNLEYNVSSVPVIKIENETAIYSGQTFYCSEDSKCLRADDLLLFK